MRLVSKLATAAFIAVALPAVSPADDRAPGHDRLDPVQTPAPLPYDPHRDFRPGDREERFDDRDVRPGDRDGRFDPGAHDGRYGERGRWHGGRRDAREAWRVRELREVHQAMRALELERRWFYAYRHTRREVRRFERSYAFRRAELDQRQDALQRYAWR